METLVAISIFTISILGIMSVLTQGVSDTNYAKSKLIATYLAQEGIEYFRNMRDTFILFDASNNGWTSFRTAINQCGTPGSSPKTCYFDDQNLIFNDSNMPITQIPIQSCGSNPCPPLFYDVNTGKYNYNLTGTNSGFIRTIQATYPPGNPNNEVKITSTVSWVQGSGSPSISFSEELFNWIE